MRGIATALISGAVMLAAARAGAQTASTSTHWAVAAASPYYGPSAAILLGFATNDLNLGLGARGGYTLPNNIYIGGTLVYHVGTSSEVTFLGATTKVSAHFLYLGPEGGYDIAAGPVLVRPYLGLGPGFASGSSSIGIAGGNTMEVSNSSTNFAIWLGGTVLYPISQFFVGGDLRALFVSNANSIGIFATGGLTF